MGLQLGGLVSGGGGLIIGCTFCLQVDGPIIGGLLVAGWFLKRQFAVG